MQPRTIFGPASVWLAGYRAARTRFPPRIPAADWPPSTQAREQAAGHSAVAGFVTGGVVSVAVLVALMWFQYSAFAQAHQLRLFEDEQERPDAG